MNIFKKEKKIKESEDSSTNGVKLVSVANTSSLYAEQFNSIRTSIRYSSADIKYKNLLVTSSIASEGKSTISGNLAVSFARQGSSVLLVDADLRRPTVEKTFEITEQKGLTNLLTEDNIKPSSVIYQTDVSDLSVLPSGPIPPSPADLLSSKKMDSLINQFNSQYDLVIYDSAPVLSVTDSQILATKLDGTIIVARANFVDKRKVETAVRSLRNVGGKIIGLILNDTEIPDDVYYYHKNKKSK